MTYYINRAGQQYGPYTLADLQKYLNDGNVVPTDLARGEGMQNWVPVTQILGAAGAPAPAAPAPTPAPVQPAFGQPPAGGPSLAQPQYGQPAAAAQPAFVQPATWQKPYAQPAMAAPLPPSLHWALVLLISFFCGIFAIVWMFIQARWVKKIVPTNNTTMMYILYLGCLVLAYTVMIIGAVAEEPALAFVGFFPLIGALVFWLIGIFRLRADMQYYYNSVEPINLRLSGVMTFFFNTLYFQYHMKRIYDWKTTGMIQPQ